MLNKILEEDCYMLDIESTGLSPITNGMTSFALVKFNPNASTLAQSIKSYMHHRINSSINVDMYRQNDTETLKFRRDNGIDKVEDTLNCIHSLQEIPQTINSSLKETNINHRHVFALHTEFDIAFLRGYYEAAGDEFSFTHRNIWELSSLITGMGQDLKEIRDDETIVDKLEVVAGKFKFENFQPHNALYDCIRQIAFLRAALILSGRL